MSSSGTSDDLVAICGVLLPLVVVPAMVIVLLCVEIELQGLLYIVDGLEV